MNLIDLDGLMPSPQDAAAMAEFIYNNDGTVKPGESVINGWELLEVHTNTDNWFTRNLTANGLVIGEFRYTHDDGTYEYALVNQGTTMTSVGNWVDNARQGLPSGLSLDTKDSIKFVRKFVAGRPNAEITMIGHSKGGAEARMNALATGSNAILFNPVTSSWSSARQNGVSRRDIRNYDGTMITYVVEGEILNKLQGWYTEHIGILRWLQAPESMGTFERHGMAAVIDALNMRYGFNDAGGMCEP